MIDLIAASARQCHRNIGTAIGIMNDLNDSHRALEPLPRTKTAGGLIGHLCVTGDYGRKICGRANGTESVHARGGWSTTRVAGLSIKSTETA